MFLFLRVVATTEISRGRNNMSTRSPGYENRRYDLSLFPNKSVYSEWSAVEYPQHRLPAGGTQLL
jgi:hypothetical protein